MKKINIDELELQFCETCGNIFANKNKCPICELKLEFLKLLKETIEVLR